MVVMNSFPRITVDADQMGGVPCIRSLRIPVATVLRMLAGGITESNILTEYPDLEVEDIRESLRLPLRRRWNVSFRFSAREIPNRQAGRFGGAGGFACRWQR
jgi:uncharacterized protein (DUF433 family)